MRYAYISVLIIALFANTVALHAQEPYRTPPDELARLVDVPRLPGISLSPDGSRMLLLERPSLPSIEEVAGDELRLAGIRFNPVTSGPSRSGSYDGITIREIDGEGSVDITGIPPDGSIGLVRWSPDGRRIAMTVTHADRITIFFADAADGIARPLDGITVHNAFTGPPFDWFSDGRRLLIRTIPADRGPAPDARRTPAGPVVRETEVVASPSRTHADLLADAHDEALFEHFMRSQLVVADVGGDVMPFAEPMLAGSMSTSPDGRYVLIESVHRPYSHLVPAERFPRRIEVYDAHGRHVHTVADLPLLESLPPGIGSAPEGPRNVHWRDDAPAQLAWVEALDGGDASADADVRDRVMLHAAPFDDAPVELITLQFRSAGIHWARGDLALVAESWVPERLRRVYRVRPDEPAATPRVILEHATDDRFGNPGYFVFEPSDDGSQVLVNDGNRVFLTGSGASPDGDRPFLRSLDVDSGDIQELFRSADPYHEVPVEVIATNPLRLLTRRESTDAPPNYFVRNLGSGVEHRLTDFPHPYPDLAGIQKLFYEYEREDGVRLGATVYLPPDYVAGEGRPLPGVMWAYPRSFRSADAAGQVSGSRNRFTYISYAGAVPFVTMGYAVIIPSMPVIGDDVSEPNDRLVDQLVMNARAAIEMGTARKFLDPDRVAVGGHSYGAFMTANLLAHSDLFRAGIAQSGAYNRTLTPFGFQSERRSLWEVPEVYIRASPFIHADGIDEPILLIHGAADNNQGTFPMQSERLYDALRGLGKTARLVMLPGESHSYSSRESVLHVLWEMNQWLEKHVRPPSSAAN